MPLPHHLVASMTREEKEKHILSIRKQAERNWQKDKENIVFSKGGLVAVGGAGLALFVFAKFIYETINALVHGGIVASNQYVDNELETTVFRIVVCLSWSLLVGLFLWGPRQRYKKRMALADEIERELDSPFEQANK